ncbi:MAG: hypothetical protein MUO35_14145, partial [Anaerolineales bacterium]|nr:hypothetical protein [Anaerolineales bacterium]
MSYQQNINTGLDRAYADAPSLPVDLRSLRLVILSDLHRGAGDDADDFRACQGTYAAALEHYWRRGHILGVLGDAEELWECRPDEVVVRYAGSIGLEKAFHDAGRYWRFRGNHDEDWRIPGEVERYLEPILGRVATLESLRLEVMDGRERLGEIFIVHGHQGTLWADRLDWLSHALLHAVWRPIQRLTNYKTTTAATDWRLGRKHEFAVYNWAVRKPGMIIITGHTHHPVFPSPARFDQLTA